MLNSLQGTFSISNFRIWKLSEWIPHPKICRSTSNKHFYSRIFKNVPSCGLLAMFVKPDLHPIFWSHSSSRSDWCRWLSPSCSAKANWVWIPHIVRHVGGLQQWLQVNEGTQVEEGVSFSFRINGFCQFWPPFDFFILFLRELALWNFFIWRIVAMPTR